MCHALYWSIEVELGLSTKKEPGLAIEGQTMKYADNDVLDNLYIFINSDSLYSVHHLSILIPFLLLFIIEFWIMLSL